jgi:hypothetical protein
MGRLGRGPSALRQLDRWHLERPNNVVIDDDSGRAQLARLVLTVSRALELALFMDAKLKVSTARPRYQSPRHIVRRGLTKKRNPGRSGGRGVSWDSRIPRRGAVALLAPFAAARHRRRGDRMSDRARWCLRVAFEASVLVSPHEATRVHSPIGSAGFTSRGHLPTMSERTAQALGSAAVCPNWARTVLRGGQ